MDNASKRGKLELEYPGLFEAENRNREPQSHSETRDGDEQETVCQ